MKKDGKASAFAQLWRVYQPYRTDAFFMYFFFVFQHCSVWLAPILIARLVDLAVEMPDDRMFWFWVYGGLMTAMIAWNMPASVLRQRRVSTIARGVSKDLRVAICRQLQQLSLLFHYKTNVGRMHSKAIRDIELLEQLPQVSIAIFTTLVNVVVAVIAIGIRKPEALAIFVLLVPCVVIIRRIFATRLRDRARAYRMTFEDMSAKLSDMLTMIPVTRAHGAEDDELIDVSERIHNAFRRGMKLDVMVAAFGATGWQTMKFAEIAFVLGATYAAFHDVISVGDVVMFGAFFASISNSLTQLLNILPVATQSRESAMSLYEVLDAPDVERNEGKRELKSIDGGIKFRDVSFRYPDVLDYALEGVSLSIPAGTSVAFVGPSGCGKSTLVSLVLGFIRAQEGEVLVDGHDLNELNMRLFRRAFVGVVTQEILFMSDSIGKNVAHGSSHVPEEQLIKVLKLANAWEFVEKLPDGLRTKLGEAGMRLSGGQQQRLAIARALIRDPRILVLDEATSALDVESEMLVQAAMGEIMKDRTSIVVAHRLSTVRRCDMIVVMEEGRIVAKGSHDQLMSDDNFYSRAVEAVGE